MMMTVSGINVKVLLTTFNVHLTVLTSCLAICVELFLYFSTYCIKTHISEVIRKAIVRYHHALS